MKEIIYHTKLATGWKKPTVITVCLLIEGRKPLARGVSVCSPKDTYSRKLGNTIARGRAAKALRLTDKYGYFGVQICRATCFRVKGEYQPVLRAYEEEIISKNGNK